MKRLILVRHAKAEEKGLLTSDADRILTKRGKKQSKMMAELLAGLNVKPDIVLTSSAKRASETADIFIKILKYPSSKVIRTAFLYDYFSTNRFISYLKELNLQSDTLLVFGHNPSMFDLTRNLCCNFEEERFPKCGMAVIEFNKDKWENIDKGEGNLIFFEYPKKES
jgi:phosphohistidine phosphatase